MTQSTQAWRIPFQKWLWRNWSFCSLLLLVFVCFFRVGTLHIPASKQELPEASAEPISLDFLLNTSVSRSPDLSHTNAETPPRGRSQPSIRLFIGIFTAAKGVDSKFGKRRAAIRDTWLPAAKSLDGAETRFVVGNADDAVIMEKLRAEMQKFKDEFMHMDMRDCAQCLTEKMAAFLFTVSTIYDAEWIMKVDDDVYLSPVRVLPVLRQWDRIGADHVGCFRHGSVPAAGEPAGFLLGSRYPLHPYSALFAVRGPVVRDVLRPNSLMFRHFSSQGVTLGAWLLAFNVTFFEDTRLCAPPLCRPAAVAFQQLHCGGLCEPLAELRELHTRKGCTRPFDDDASPRYIPSQSGGGAFGAMAVP